ncbi:hypothetical protein [Coprococcus sp. OM06-25]|uniref:hypothetical protein n=1 Tax=Coprococcus sp. OM06-25 TaxID=2293094 RepID=UPI003FA40E6C
MAEDKKTRLELEEQKRIADEVREVFDENSTKLRKSYSADAQKLLKEMDNYYGDVKESTIGKRLETFLENEKNILGILQEGAEAFAGVGAGSSDGGFLHFYRQHNQVADKPVLLQKNHAYEEVWGIS